jgi:hypothetical protein
MIPANKDPERLIKEKDQHFWHVLLIRKTVNPHNSKEVWEDSFVQIFDTRNFDRIFRPERLGAKAADYKKACLIDEARVIHNPELVTEKPYIEEPVAHRVAPVAPAYSKPKPRKSSK